MEVVNENAAMLSNYEVYTLLSDIQAGRGQKKPNKSLQQLATITYEAVKYLENKPCKEQTPEIVEQFMSDLKPYNLTKAEKLQMLNHYPSTAVEIQLIVEESEERLTEEQIYELLDLMAKYNPNSVEAEEAAEGDGNENDENEEVISDDNMEES